MRQLIGIFSSAFKLPVVSGGTLTSDSTYYYRTFKSTSSLTISNGSVPCEYLVIGGGGGGRPGSSGGSAGQASYQSATVNPGLYDVIVGGGGNYGGGTTSSFNSLSGTGGAWGTYVGWGAGNGGPGAGGSGSAKSGNYGGAGGSGSASYDVWANATSTGRSGLYAGGGGGGSSRIQYSASGGTGGGGPGGWALDNGTSNDMFISDGSGRDMFGDGYLNTGGGGGGGGSSLAYSQQSEFFPGKGGSGIVIIRYAKTAVGG